MDASAEPHYTDDCLVWFDSFRGSSLDFPREFYEWSAVNHAGSRRSCRRATFTFDAETASDLLTDMSGERDRNCLRIADRYVRGE